MKIRLPDKSLCEEFEQLIKDTKEEEIRKYLGKSFAAFKSGHLECAVVLTWAGVERYYHLVCEDIGLWYFKKVYEKERGREPKYLTVSAFDGISHQAHIFHNFKVNPKDPPKQWKTHHDRLKDLRDKVAHGRGRFCSNPKEVLEVISSIHSLVVRKISDEKFSNTDEAIKFLITEKEIPGEIDQLFAHFPVETDWVPKCYTLNDAYLKDLDVEKESVETLAKCIYKNLTPDKQLIVWKDYAEKALAYLKAVIGVDERMIGIYSFLPLPPKVQALTIRDKFLEHFFELIEDKILYVNGLDPRQERSDEDYNLAKTIDKLIKRIEPDVPDHLQDKWNKISKQWRPIL